MRVLLVAFLALVVACKPAKPPAPTPPAAPAQPPPEPTPPAQPLSDVELEALMRDVARLMGELATAVEAEADCVAMAGAIDGVVDEHAAVLERMRGLKDPAIEDRVHVWMTKHGARVEEYGERVAAAVQRCAGEPRVEAAMERLSAIDVVPKDRVASAVEDSVRLYEEIGKLEPATPCDGAAAAIARMIGARGDALRSVRTAARDRRSAIVDARFGDAAARLGVALAAIERMTVRCGGEPAVAAALAQLEGA